MGSLAAQSIKGVFWSAVERFSLQGVQFVIGVILARLLSPSDFGMIGMLTIFLSISQIFVDCGFSNALIRKKDVSSADYGTAFTVNFLISCVCFALLFISAPFVSDFYKMPELESVMRVISLSILINALFTVHKAKLTKNVDFKTQSKVSFLAAAISGALGISLAYCDFGVWSLVWQNISNAGLNLVFFTILLKWFPRPCINRASFNELFGFGSKLLVSSLIHSVYSNMYNIVIGRCFTAAKLGFYTRADHLAAFPSSNVASILNRVTYPILSKLQDDPDKLLDVYKKYLQLSCFFVFPLMMGLCALAKPVIILLLGEKWDGAIFLMQILCLGLMFDPICNINLNVLYVKGRSDLVLRLEIIKKTIAVAILIVSLYYGLVGMCVGRAIYGVISTFLNMIYTKRFINLSMVQQIRLIVPAYLLSVFMAACVYGGASIVGAYSLQLLVGVAIGVIVYLSVAYILRMNAFVIGVQYLRNRK